MTAFPKIKFSHTYLKFPCGWGEAGKIKLLDCWTMDTKDFSQEFVEYDTSYWENDAGGNYPLPVGKVLVLIFRFPLCAGTNIMTTVRRWTPEKEKYYRGLIGKALDFEIEQKVAK